MHCSAPARTIFGLAVLRDNGFTVQLNVFASQQIELLTRRDSLNVKLHNSLMNRKQTTSYVVLKGLQQEFIRKDRRKELLYYVNLIRAC